MIGWQCPHCGKALNGPDEACQGSFAERDHPNERAVANMIVFEDRPWRNERLYRHGGCAKWVVPLDDCPEPTGDRECGVCARSFPVISARTLHKGEDIDLAARAVFEGMKAAVDDLRRADWELLPETAGSELHPMRCKAYYRQQVSTGIEALWRAGRLRATGFAALVEALYVAENDPKESPGDYAQIARWIEKRFDVNVGRRATEIDST